MRKNAITLIELLVAVAITAVLTVTVTVSLGVYNRRRLEVAGRSFTSEMMLLRQRAVSERAFYFVDFDIANDAYSVFNETMDAAHLVKTVPLGVDLVTVRYPTVSGWISPTLGEADLNPAEIRFNATLGNITRANGNPISPAGTPVNAVLLNLTWAGRSVAVVLFGETGYAAYKPQYSTSGRCFIATAVYGHSMPPAKKPEAITVLEQFRDRCLVSDAPGRSLIDFYYYVSPALAAYIAPRPWARAAGRLFLNPVVWFARHCGG